MLLASVDERDPARQARARSGSLLLANAQRAHQLAGAQQVVQIKPSSAFPVPCAAASACQVRRLRVWLPPHLDAYTVDGAWDLQDRYGLGYWDALIVSSAHQQGCRYLLTEALPARPGAGRRARASTQLLAPKNWTPPMTSAATPTDTLASLEPHPPDVRAMHSYVVQPSTGMLKMDAMENLHLA